MTDAEKRLWRELRELGIESRFRRQHPIGAYIVDFAAPAAKLAIELDGGQHAINRKQDEALTQELAAMANRLIRFWNGDVMDNIEGVSLAIKQVLKISLSALGRGEVGEASPDASEAHLTLPVADATGPRPLRPGGRRGHGADRV
jgi:very-short-patch-repair endonuclease